MLKFTEMNVFITGASGYVGKRISKILAEKGHEVRALVRPGSEHKVPGKCKIIYGNALKSSSYTEEVYGCYTLVHLVGVSHPSPKKKEQFISVDLKSARQAAIAAQQAGIKHIIYISVAQTPAKIMQDYQAARLQAEEAFKNTGINLTILRPWYVIGPGHYWPLFFLPLYALLRLIPSTREKAIKLQLVYLPQVLRALTYAVENPAKGVRVIEIADIREF